MMAFMPVPAPPLLVSAPDLQTLRSWTRSGSIAAALSNFRVAAIGRAYGLKPHRTETFKFSTDPELEAKIRDVTGLYLNPPERAIVLCVDEKSQIQALDLTHPLLPLRPGGVA